MAAEEQRFDRFGEGDADREALGERLGGHAHAEQRGPADFTAEGFEGELPAVGLDGKRADLWQQDGDDAGQADTSQQFRDAFEVGRREDPRQEQRSQRDRDDSERCGPAALRLLHGLVT
jgi:hypothetical protein